jgi:hypothetical protein
VQIKHWSWTVNTSKVISLLVCLANAAVARGADLGTLKDFVHLSEPGKGTFVYVLGEGVQVEAGNVSTCYTTRTQILTTIVLVKLRIRVSPSQRQCRQYTGTPDECVLCQK